MTLSASASFVLAENSDVRKIAAKVYIVLGNYCPKYYSVSTGDNFSTDYLVSGAVDGDRSALNVGPASGAENDVGNGGWRSLNQPDSTPASMSVAFGEAVGGVVKTPRIINRIKVYHMSGHTMSQYAIFGDSSSALSHDLKLATTAGYTSPGGVTIVTTGTVDTITIPDTTVYGLQIVCSDTTVLNDQAWVVELEAYRVVDVTDYVMSIQVDRSRDYKLQNPLAAAAQITFDNSDRFFSFNHTPTAAETTAGFVNAELVPNIGLEISFGYDYGGTTEVVSSFVGNVDRLTVEPATRTATIAARDYTKILLNNSTSSKLKSASDIGALVQYLLNLVNISSFESAIDTAGIVVDYFFTEAENVLSTIHDLVQAAADAVFYFSETGVATFKAFLSAIPQSHLWTTQADFVACSVKNLVDTDSVVNAVIPKWVLMDNFPNSDFVSNPPWFDPLANNFWTATAANGLAPQASSTAGENFLYMYGNNPLLGATPGLIGTWECTLKFPTSGGYPNMAFYFIMGNGQPDGTTGDNHFTDSYYVLADKANSRIRLYKMGAYGPGTTPTQLATSALSYDTAVHTLRVTRTAAGLMTVYWDTVSKLTATDTSITSIGQTFGVRVNSFSSAIVGGQYFNNFRYSYTVDGTNAFDNATAYIESDVLDQSVDVSSEGIIQANYNVLAHSAVDLATSTSSDGVTFPDGYVHVANGGTIASTMRRYIKWRAILYRASEFGYQGIEIPELFDVTINWVKGGGSAKYPASSSATFSYNGALIAIAQEYADNLGGDTAILNDVTVQGHPVLLTGTNADVQWHGTVQVPPVTIDGSNPLTVSNGQVLTYSLNIAGGMDTSRMSGGSPAAAVITFASSATGTWLFTTINPTHPVLQITITHAGTITKLEVQGKSYADSQTVALQRVTDSASIKNYGPRQTSIDNKWISNTGLALSVANAVLTNFKNPIIHIYQCEVSTSFLIQIGDRVTIVDTNLDISADYYVTGYTHIVQAGIQNGMAKTVLKLFKI